MVKADNSDPRTAEFAATEQCRQCYKSKAVCPIMLRCSRCGVPYCSAECQKKDWKSHKPMCQSHEQRMQHKDPRSQVTTALANQLHMWSRLYHTRLGEANFMATDTAYHPEKYEDNVLFIKLSRTKEVDQANLAHFFAFEAAELVSFERVKSQNLQLYQFTRDAIKEALSKTSIGITFTILRCQDCILPIMHGISQSFADSIQVHKVPMSPTWKEDLSTDITMGRHQSLWLPESK